MSETRGHDSQGGGFQDPHGLADEGAWAEDFEVGQRMAHPRGATIGEFEGQSLAKLVMNTAESHWNEARFAGGSMLGQGRVVFGLITASLVIGLSSQDTMAHGIAEVGLQGVRFPAPVHLGDTLHAFTEVVEVDRGYRADAALVTFRHWGIRTDGTVVFQGDRAVLVARTTAREDIT